MAKARPIPGLTEGQPYAAAAAKVVRVRTGEVLDFAAGVLDVSDIERVHEMRVATRRLRAALEFFEPCFPRKPFRRALREVKALADALGERRDRDVTIEALEGFAEEVGLADRPGVLVLAETIRAEQLEANEALRPYVAEDRLARLERRLNRLVEEAEGVAAPLASRGPNGAGPGAAGR